jgi:DNA-binding winged helix-turn-helix (wHTH) protein
MADNKEIIYPVTKETMHAYAKSIFASITQGESITTVWVPMAGRRMWNKFIVENISLFKEELPDYNNYVLVYVEPLDLTEESLIGYLRLMAKSFLAATQSNDRITIPQELITVLDKSETSYPILLDLIKKLISDATSSGFGVVFFLGEFDELPFINKIFCNNLKSLWSSLYPRLQYVFPLIKPIDIKRDIYLWDELSEALLQNVITISLPQNKDFEYICTFYANQIKVTITENVLMLLKEMTGGHPYLIKTALRAIKDMNFDDLTSIRQHLLMNRELRSIAYGIYDKRSAEEKILLKKIIDRVPLNESEIHSLESMSQLGLIIKKDDQFEVSSELFKKVIREENSTDSSNPQPKELKFDLETSAIIFNGKNLEEHFTRQEYALLSSLLKTSGALLTKESIGDALWGDNSYEQYSDWAIDQLMSKLRKKLKNLGINAEIVTLRGRGYLLKLH